MKFDPNKSQVLNFGKYKGQSIEILSQDKQYTDWLVSQDWFKERYSSIHTLIVNNFSQASETPEHNSMQALFVDQDFVQRFIDKLFNQKKLDSEISWKSGYLHAELQNSEELLERTKKIIASEESPTAWRLADLKEKEERESKYCKEIKSKLSAFEKSSVGLSIQRIGFEIAGSDVCIDYSFSKGPVSYNGEARIELKPQMGDDYPTILRQMKASKSNALLIKDYTGIGASFEQVQKIFAASRIKILFLADI